jgi:S1-C subfamily serine protease
MPDEPTPEATEASTPTATATAPPPPAAPAVPPTPPTPDAPPPADGSHRRGALYGVVIVLVAAALVVGGFLVGRSTADSGPSSLADAVQQTTKGDLPVGNLSLQQILGALGQNKASSGLGNILGGNGSTSSLDQLLQNLLKRLGNESNGGSSSGSGSGATNGLQAYLGVGASDGTGGALVASVVGGGPADQAGIKAGDVITAVGSTTVKNAAGLAAAVRAHEPGDLVAVTITRDGQSSTVNVRLGNTSSGSTPTTTAPPSTSGAV